MQSHVRTVRLNSRNLRQVVQPVLDDDVVAAQHAEQRRETLTQINQSFSAAGRDATRAEAPVVTSWMSMSEFERARIRPPRRRTAAGLLVLVRDHDTATIAVSVEGEAA